MSGSTIFSISVPPPPIPAVISVFPSAGVVAGGTSVVITGAYFSGVTGVKFGATNAASFVVNSSTQITAVTPAESAGVTDVTVTNPSGTSPTSPYDHFSFGFPNVSSVSPNSGPLAGGTSVVIAGTSFTGTTSVKFGGVNASSFTVNSSIQITATSPAGSAGTVDIVVTNANGSSPTGIADNFTYAAVPTVTSVSPSSGPAAGGTSVTINGTSFIGLSGAAAVKFGAVNATSYVVVSPVQIVAVSPARAAGAVDITVTAAGGTSATSGSDQYVFF